MAPLQTFTQSFEEEGRIFEKGIRNNRVFSSGNIQTGPFSACNGDFVTIFFHSPAIHSSSRKDKFLIGWQNTRKWNSPKMNENHGISVLGAYKLYHVQSVVLILSQNVSTPAEYEKRKFSKN